MKKVAITACLVALVAAPGFAVVGHDMATALLHESPSSLSFDFKEADVLDVLRLLADAGGFAFSAGADVGGTVTLRFAARDWEEALAVVAGAAGLEVERTGGVVRVETTAAGIAAAEAVRRLHDAREQAAPLVTAIIPMRFADAKVIAELLVGEGSERTSGADLLSDRGLMFADPGANVLFVADVPERLARVEGLVAQLDRLPQQVLIESEIVETSADTGFALGIQWGYRGAFGSRTGADGSEQPDVEVGGSGVGESIDSVPLIGSFPAPVVPLAGSALDVAWGALGGSQALALRLSALEREGQARVVSRPRVVTLNSVPATIKSLTVIRVKLPSTDTLVRTDDASGVFPSAATEKIETGIVLVVTPRIVAGQRVVLDLFVKSSQADFSREVDGIPTETSREATSRVVVADGETVVLGGIYADTSDHRMSGVPFLRDLPGIGWLFKGTERATRREDLLVFITPRILGTVPAAVEPPVDGAG